MNIVIIGGGIAGLSAATVLQELGNSVTLIEKNKELGGLVRSHYDKLTYYQEHTPRVYFKNYYNFFSLMERIPLYYQKQPTDKQLINIFQKLESNYLVNEYGLTSTNIFKMMFKSNLNILELLMLGFFVLRYMMCSTERLQDDADRVSVSSFIKSKAGRKRFEMLSLIMGETLDKLPMHKLVRLLEQNISGEGLRITKGNTNEYLFHNWELYLRKIGVKVLKEKQVEYISKDMNTYTINTKTGKFGGFSKIIMGTDIWSMIKIFEKSNIKVDPHLYELSEEAKSNQMGLNIYFPNSIKFKYKSIFALEDTDWKLIIEPKDSNWSQDTKIGIWSVSIPDDNLYSQKLGKALKDCSPNEIFEEVWDQIYNSRIFDATEVSKEHIMPTYYKIWDGWDTTKDSVVNKEPYFWNAVGTFGKRPEQDIGLKNIFLAGAYTKTSYYHYWVEGACESGLIAAQSIDYRVNIIKHERIRPLKIIHKIDKFLYQEYLPCAFDLGLILIGGILIYKKLI